MTRCLLHGVLALVLCGATTSLTACKQQAPEPWREMKLPLRHAEILPGANERRIKLRYRKTSLREELLREFGSRLERAGYRYDRDGKGHDPAGRTYSVIYKKGGDELLMTISGAGGTDTTVELGRME